MVSRPIERIYSVKIICVRIGDRYGPEYEEYIENKLSDYDIHWIREETIGLLQWNKLEGMNWDTDEPVCVTDIDVLLINDYKEVFEYPIERGQFLAAPGWWRWGKHGDLVNGRFTINGGFQKYYPKDCRYIYEKFIDNPSYWMRYYIDNGFTSGPVNGEQHFVEESVKERLELKLLPDAWFCRMEARNTEDNTISLLNARYKMITGNPYMYVGGKFHPDIKFVHFTHRQNLPHNWRDFKLFGET